MNIQWSKQQISGHGRRLVISRGIALPVGSLSVGPWTRVMKWGNVHLDAYVCVRRVGWGVDTSGSMPLPTRPRRYCNPALLV